MSERMTLDYWKSQLDEEWLTTMSIIHKDKSIEDAVIGSFGHILANPDRLANSNASDFKKLVNTWLSNMPRPKKVAQKLNFDDL